MRRPVVQPSMMAYERPPIRVWYQACGFQRGPLFRRHCGRGPLPRDGGTGDAPHEAASGGDDSLGPRRQDGEGGDRVVGVEG